MTKKSVFDVDRGSLGFGRLRELLTEVGRHVWYENKDEISHFKVVLVL